MSEEVEQIAETPVGETSGTLLDSAEPTLNENEYYLSDGIKGVGEKPEWLHERYKSVADQAKGYSELEKKFGSFAGSPKDGYETPEGIETDDALYQELEAFATKTNMSADAFGEAWELLATQSSVAEEVSQTQELQKLGPNADKRIKHVETYMKNNLSSEQYETAKEAVNSAETIALVEMLIKAETETALPIDGGVHPEGLTWANVETEMFRKDDSGQLLRITSAAHEQKLQKMMASFEGKV
jgi:hypothetical protein|tara:strand:+ start:5046 stop:5771 length:726 start_codon:yes stop_codon:yes gene_type:complete